MFCSASSTRQPKHAPERHSLPFTLHLPSLDAGKGSVLHISHMQSNIAFPAFHHPTAPQCRGAAVKGIQEAWAGA